MSDATIPTGQMRPTDQVGEYNRQRFVIDQAVRGIQTAIPVEVVAVTNAGGVSPVGFVDVVPLVNQIDGRGNPVPHATIYNVPYNRIQGGANAIIIDPQVGDIGMAAFCSRDISKVKKTKGRANPGSLRSHSFSDGMYFGGFLNAAPTQYIQFNADGITIHSPAAVAVTAPTVSVTATTSATISAPVASVTATASATITAPVISLGGAGQTMRKLVNELFQSVFNGHTHPDPNGGNTGTPNQTLDASHMTSTAKCA